MKVSPTKVLKNLGSGIIKGNLLMRLGVDRYFIHIIFILCLCGLSILFSLLIDRRLNVVVKNDSRLEEQRLEMTVQEFELARFTRRTEVGEMLLEMGSKVSEPKKPATVVLK